MRHLAVNPIQYWARAGRTQEVLDAAFAELSAIGFTAVKADVPEGMTAAAYLDWLDGYGLAPSVSLFSSAFDETDRHRRGDRAGQAVRSRPGRARDWTGPWCRRSPCRPGWSGPPSAPTSAGAGSTWRSRTAG